MNALEGDQLRLVFQLCQPNDANMISLNRLQNLLDQHTHAQEKGHQDPQDLLTDFKVASGSGDEWLTFDEFCQAVASLYETSEAGTGFDETDGFHSGHEEDHSSFEVGFLYEDSFESTPSPDCVLGTASPTDFDDGKAQSDSGYRPTKQKLSSVKPRRSPRSRDRITSENSRNQGESALESQEMLDLASSDAISDDRGVNFVTFGRNNDIASNKVKKVSSNGFGSVLYHEHGGGNSSGCSSNGDELDMPSDVSIGDDLTDLNQKVQTLQDQIRQLVDSQSTSDERFSKVRQENVVLMQRIHALEEQLREVDYRSVEQMAEEKKRHEDLVARMEREKQLQREHDSIKLLSVERDLKSSLSEVTTLRSQNDRLKFEKSQCDQELFESQRIVLQTQLELSKVQEINRREYGSMMEERKVNQHIVDELNKELESLKSFKSSTLSRVDFVDFSTRPSLSLSSLQDIHDLQDEIRSLREENKKLRESNDSLEAVLMSRSLQQGQEVLSKTRKEGTSIADELEVDDSQLRSSLKEQQEVNAQLRGYIDGILMNIIDKYPELLEVQK